MTDGVGGASGDDATSDTRGVRRKVDHLGRVVIPASMRRKITLQAVFT